MPIFVPATSTRSWRDLQPKHHWKHGYSAKSLADHWQGEDGFPPDVRELFTSASVPGINDAEMLFGVPEWKTKLPGKGRDSQTDLFVLADSGDGLLSK